MTAERDLQREEDERITRVLEELPAVGVPKDFAARVMAQLPERKFARVPADAWNVRRTHYGRNAMLLFAALLCALLVAGAVMRGDGRAWQLAEALALLQLVAIVLWWGLGWRTRSTV